MPLIQIPKTQGELAQAAKAVAAQAKKQLGNGTDFLVIAIDLVSEKTHWAATVPQALAERVLQGTLKDLEQGGHA